MKNWKLFIVAVILILIAFFLQNSTKTDQPKDPKIGAALLLSAEIDLVKAIEIAYSDAELNLKSESGKWKVADKRGFPADNNKIEELFQKMNNAKVVEMVSANTARHADLGVAKPEDGKKPEQENIIISFKDSVGKTIKTIFFGKGRQSKSQDGMPGFGTAGQYVRFDGNDSTYLVTEQIWLEKNPKRWLKTEILKLQEAEIKKVIWDYPSDVKDIELVRETATESFQLSGIPADHQLKKSVMDEAMRFFANLAFDDLIESENPEMHENLADAVSVALETFAGAKFTLKVGVKETDLENLGKVNLMAIKAVYDGEDGVIKSGISEISETASGSVFAIRNFRLKPMLVKYEALVEKKPEPVSDENASGAVEVAASHILVAWKGAERSNAERNKEEAKKLAAEILEKIKKGEAFEALAEQYSDCSSGKSAKGSLGKFGKGIMAKEFEKTAFSLKVGELSSVIETNFGYHIIRRDE